MPMKRAAVAAWVSAALIAALALPAAACGSAVGEQVMLRSIDLDPDVFVWDARDLMIEYASGTWLPTATVFRHALLSGPGTRAVTVGCVAGAVRPSYASPPLDAIAVRLLSGPHRGRYGWVSSSDVHPLRDAVR